ncbi:MAG: DUF4286 family protein [Niabella sp.]
MSPIIYNVTTKVTHAVHKDWLAWLKQTHIPQIINTGCFSKAVILKLIQVDETDGVTYAVQYYAATTAAYNTYEARFAAEIEQHVFDKWGGQTLFFATLMEVVN